MPVREQGVVCAKEVIKQHPEGIDRRDGRIQELIILMGKVIRIQDSKPLGRNCIFQLAPVQVRARAVIALNNNNGRRC